MSNHVLEHPVLGPVRGITKTAAVTQYLGIQYARLKDRFSRGEILLKPPSDHSRLFGNVLDATKSGYGTAVLIVPEVSEYCGREKAC